MPEPPAPANSTVCAAPSTLMRFTAQSSTNLPRRSRARTPAASSRDGPCGRAETSGAVGKRRRSSSVRRLMSSCSIHWSEVTWRPSFSRMLRAEHRLQLEDAPEVVPAPISTLDSHRALSATSRTGWRRFLQCQHAHVRRLRNTADPRQGQPGEKPATCDHGIAGRMRRAGVVTDEPRVAQRP